MSVLIGMDGVYRVYLVVADMRVVVVSKKRVSRICDRAVASLR